MKINEILNEAAGVGTVNSQNSTKDVNPGTIRKNLKAFNLIEGPSVQSTVSAILADSGSSINMLYDSMQSAAQKLVDNRGDVNGMGIVLGGFTSRWMDRFYFNRLQSELHDLVKYYPKSSSTLKKVLMSNLRKYSSLVEYIPDQLIHIGKAEKNADLVKAGRHWAARHAKFQQFLQDLKVSLEDDTTERPSKPSSYGSQMDAAEKIVADILRKIPGKAAGEIRNAIARSSNKIVALQQELANRGIDPNKL